MRHAAQCLGRVLRGKDDYGIMVLADRRFTRKKNQLPKWIAQALNDSDTNLSTDMALATAKSFCVVWRSQLTRKTWKGYRYGISSSCRSTNSSFKKTKWILMRRI